MKASIYLIALLLLQNLLTSAWASQPQQTNSYHQVIKPYVDHHAFNGVVLVAKNGQVVFEQGYGTANATWNVANKPDTRFGLASLSKPVTALLVMQMVQAGKLKLSDTLDKYLPYLPPEKSKRMTIEALLGHRSGLPRQFVIEGWTQGKYDRLSDKEAYAKVIGQLELIAEPGERYAYTNLGYFLLALVVEKVSGMSFEQALAHHIFKPLGMDDTGSLSNDGIVPNLAQSYQIAADGGYKRAAYRNMNLFWAGASLYSTASDLLKFEQALYTDKLLDDKHRAILLAKENGFNWYHESWTLAEGGPAINTMNWGGELPGLSSFMVRLIDDKNTIVILSNDGLNEVAKRAMAKQLANVLYLGQYKQQKPSLSLVLTQALYEGNLAQVIAKVKPLKDNYLVDKSIEQIGLQMMWSGELDKAVSLLALNAHYFPQSPAAHENLSQALEAKQLWSMALKSKLQALKLLPENPYLQQEVARLKKAM